MVIGRAALAPSTVDTTSAAMGATVDATGPVPDDGVEATDDGVEATDDGVEATDDGVEATDDGVEATDDGVEVPEAGVEPTELSGVASGVAPAPFDRGLAEAVEPLAAGADVVPAGLELSEPGPDAALGVGEGVAGRAVAVTA
jgi:hypothetical protein